LRRQFGANSWHQPDAGKQTFEAALTFVPHALGGQGVTELKGTKHVRSLCLPPAQISHAAKLFQGPANE